MFLLRILVFELQQVSVFTVFYFSKKRRSPHKLKSGLTFSVYRVGADGLLLSIAHFLP